MKKKLIAFGFTAAAVATAATYSWQEGLQNEPFETAITKAADEAAAKGGVNIALGHFTAKMISYSGLTPNITDAEGLIDSAYERTGSLLPSISPRLRAAVACVHLSVQGNNHPEAEGKDIAWPQEAIDRYNAGLTAKTNSERALVTDGHFARAELACLETIEAQMAAATVDKPLRFLVLDSLAGAPNSES